MDINLKLSDDGEVSVILSSDFEPTSLDGTTKVTPSVVALLGIKMLFEAGDVFQAGMTGIQLIEEGSDPMETARQARIMREAVQEE